MTPWANDFSGKWLLGQMTPRANDPSGKWPLGPMTSRAIDRWANDPSGKWLLGQWPLGQMTVGPMTPRANDPSGKWPLGQMTPRANDPSGQWLLGQMTVGPMTPRANDRWAKDIRANDRSPLDPFDISQSCCLQVLRCLHVSLSSRMLSELLGRLVETVAEQGEDMQGYVTELMLTLEAAVDALHSDFRYLRQFLMKNENEKCLFSNVYLFCDRDKQNHATVGTRCNMKLFVGSSSILQTKCRFNILCKAGISMMNNLNIH